jgi:hypothetical protein
MRKTLAVLAVFAGWYLFTRMKAGNAYATQQGAQAYPLETGYFSGLDIMNNEPLQPLRYFNESEFGQWWPYMSTELLTKLDEFRHRLGFPVIISPAAGSLGRNLGYTDTSQHNIDMWGEVRAVDVMFSNTIDLEHAYNIAKAVGFTGIGAYPDWKPNHGLHLDVRIAPLALWSGILEGGKQVYKSITQAFT